MLKNVVYFDPKTKTSIPAVVRIAQLRTHVQLGTLTCRRAVYLVSPATLPLRVRLQAPIVVATSCPLPIAAVGFRNGLLGYQIPKPAWPVFLNLFQQQPVYCGWVSDVDEHNLPCVTYQSLAHVSFTDLVVTRVLRNHCTSPQHVLLCVFIEYRTAAVFTVFTDADDSLDMQMRSDILCKTTAAVKFFPAQMLKHRAFFQVCVDRTDLATPDRHFCVGDVVFLRIVGDFVRMHVLAVSPLVNYHGVLERVHLALGYQPPLSTPQRGLLTEARLLEIGTRKYDKSVHVAVKQQTTALPHVWYLGILCFSKHVDNGSGTWFDTDSASPSRPTYIWFNISVYDVHVFSAAFVKVKTGVVLEMYNTSFTDWLPWVPAVLARIRTRLKGFKWSRRVLDLFRQGPGVYRDPYVYYEGATPAHRSIQTAELDGYCQTWAPLFVYKRAVKGIPLATLAQQLLHMSDFDRIMSVTDFMESMRSGRVAPPDPLRPLLAKVFTNTQLWAGLPLHRLRAFVKRHPEAGMDALNQMTTTNDVWPQVYAGVACVPARISLRKRFREPHLL